MPLCVAVGCSTNTFSKNREKRFRFYSFPKDENLNKRWLANIKRENINKIQNFFINTFSIRVLK